MKKHFASIHKQVKLLHQTRLHALVTWLSIFSILLSAYVINQQAKRYILGENLVNDIPVTRSIFLLIYNPILEGQGGVTLTQFKNWSDPDTLTNQLTPRLHDASGGYITYSIVERQQVDEYPVKQDGFVYTDDTYLNCNSNSTNCHSPDGVDYGAIFQKYNICAKNVDDVWLWGGPYFGFLEYNPLNLCPGKTTFVMGFNYERGLGEAMHDFGHRMEYVVSSRVGAGITWAQNEADEWNKFSEINGHCGNVHYPPGTLSVGEYIYGYTGTVTSDCNSYASYPTGPFVAEQITCQLWGCDQTGYLSWWLGHIPKNSGTFVDPAANRTIYNNWWKYYAYFDQTGSGIATNGTFSAPSATLGQTSATFQFSYSGISSNYIIDLSTFADMSSDVYLTFGQGSQSPVVVSDPTKWDKYTCGRTLYWRAYNADRSISSPIQSAVVCPDVLVTPTPSVTAGTFSDFSSTLDTTATFRFTYSGTTSNYIVDLSTYADMSSDVYLTFGQGTQSPVIVSNPTKWDKYICGRTLYWKVYNADRSVNSPIQSGLVCPQPSITPTDTPTPTSVPTPTPTSIPTPTPTSVPTPTPFNGLYAPQSLTARTVGNTQIRLNWIDTNTIEKGYIIERSKSSTSGFVAVASVGVNKITYTDGGLSHITTYYYRVRAYGVNNTFSSYSLVVGATTSK